MNVDDDVSLAITAAIAPEAAFWENMMMPGYVFDYPICLLCILTFSTQVRLARLPPIPLRLAGSDAGFARLRFQLNAMVPSSVMTTRPHIHFYS